MKEKIEDENKNKFIIPQTYSEALLLASNQAKQIEEQQKLIEVQRYSDCRNETEGYILR